MPSRKQELELQRLIDSLTDGTGATPQQIARFAASAGFSPADLAAMAPGVDEDFVRNALGDFPELDDSRIHEYGPGQRSHVIDTGTHNPPNTGAPGGGGDNQVTRTVAEPPSYLQPFLNESANFSLGSLYALGDLLSRPNALVAPFNDTQREAMQMAANTARGGDGMLPMAQQTFADIARGDAIAPTAQLGRQFLTQGAGRDAMSSFASSPVNFGGALNSLAGFANNPMLFGGGGQSMMGSAANGHQLPPGVARGDFGGGLQARSPATAAPGTVGYQTGDLGPAARRHGIPTPNSGPLGETQLFNRSDVSIPQNVGPIQATGIGNDARMAPPPATHNGHAAGFDTSSMSTAGAGSAGLQMPPGMHNGHQTGSSMSMSTSTPRGMNFPAAHNGHAAGVDMQPSGTGSSAFNEAVQASIRQAKPHIMSQFAGGGSGAASGGLAQIGMQQAASDAFSRLYDSERNRQLSAAGTMGNLALGGRGLQQQAANSLMGADQHAGTIFSNLASQERDRQMRAAGMLPQLGLMGSNILGGIGDRQQQQEQAHRRGSIDQYQQLLGYSFGNINPTSLIGQSQISPLHQNRGAGFLGGALGGAGIANMLGLGTPWGVAAALGGGLLGGM